MSAGARAATRDTGSTADALADLLAGRFIDPDDGAPLGTSIRAIVIGDDLLDDAIARLDALGLGSRAVVVSDVDTAAALGDRVAHALLSRGPVQRLTLGHRPRADDETIDRLLAAADVDLELVVSVGSGTLTDLGKVLAFRRGLPHVAFGTAPSMNGYTSVSASVVSGGLKRSIRVAAATAVFLDTRVLAAAPPRLIRAGLGDSLSRATAQTDWFMSHLLLGRPYREAPFALLAADEAALFADPAALAAGDRAAMRHLARLLVLSGCGMTLCGGSYPASQGEHLISHYFEALHAADADAHPASSHAGPPASAASSHAGPPASAADLIEPLHGEQIGVTTLTMARLQRELLDRDAPPVVRESRIDQSDVLEHFGPALGPACWRELAPKLVDDAGAESRTARLAAIWEPLRARVATFALTPERLRSILTAAGAATTPGELGWTAARHATALRWARALRDRYTFLDLAADVGEQALPSASIA